MCMTKICCENGVFMYMIEYQIQNTFYLRGIYESL